MEKNKNIIRIKDFPSNTIDEAILILKENNRAKKLECSSKFKNSNYKKIDDEEMVIKEAEFIISEYIENSDESKKCSKNKKIRRLRALNIVLVIALIISIIL